MSNDSARPWTVLYYETALHLTNEEYSDLQRAAYDDPAEAVRMADRLLAAQS